MIEQSKKVVLKFIDLLNIKKKIKRLKMCCKEKQKIIDLLNRQIDEYGESFNSLSKK